MDISNMNGYEFEGFIAELLRKIGFVVEETSLSGDSGVDLIAYSEEPLYKGKYLIQCKCWKGNIGEPAVRDLFGVVLSNNANKGILITNSFFTQQAKNFAEGKNIELIDGNTLNKLIKKYFTSEYKKSTIPQITHFSKLDEFEIEKYKYYKHQVDTNKRSIAAYLDLFHFMYSYIVDRKTKIIYSGLIEECLSLSEEVIAKFGTKGKRGVALNRVFIPIKGILSMLLGKVDISFEIIQSSKEINFILKDFTENLVNSYYYFNPTHYYVHYSNECEMCETYRTNVLDSKWIIYKTNLLNLLIKINDDYSSKWLYEKFIGYYNCILTKLNEEKPHFRNQIYVDIANKNYNMAMEQIESLMNMKQPQLFIPTKVHIDEKEPYYSCLEYSIDSCINIKDIELFWSPELNFDTQKENIKFLISLHS
jgi:restriction system protein